MFINFFCIISVHEVDVGTYHCNITLLLIDETMKKFLQLQNLLFQNFEDCDSLIVKFSLAHT